MNRLERVSLVLVENRGVDACLIERDHRPTVLVINPHQGFSSAVQAVHALAPRASRDYVRQLVRKHLPYAPDLGEMLGLGEDSPKPWVFRPRVPLICAAVLLVMLSVGFYTLHASASIQQQRRDHGYVAGFTPAAEHPLRQAFAQFRLNTSPQLETTEAPVKQTGAPSVVKQVRQDQGVVLPAGAAAAPASDAHGSLPPADQPPCSREVLDTLAVAVLSEGPTSSASTSNTVRFSPSRVSKDRAFRLPCTITRVPFCKDSAAFSAACRQIEQLRNRVSWSTHSLRPLSNRRGVDATVKLQTAAPDGVKRSSGSAVRLPTTVMGVSPDTEAPLLVVERLRARPGD